MPLVTIVIITAIVIVVVVLPGKRSFDAIVIVPIVITIIITLVSWATSVWVRRRCLQDLFRRICGRFIIDLLNWSSAFR
jgi:Mn2+/Fe2+ NRAMP family transporter